MLTTPLSHWLHQRHWRYAWVIAAVAFLTMLSASAALGLARALLRPLGDEFGWNTEQISTALALRFVLFGLMGPFSALLMGTSINGSRPLASLPAGHETPTDASVHPRPTHQ